MYNFEFLHKIWTNHYILNILKINNHISLLCSCTDDSANSSSSKYQYVYSIYIGIFINKNQFEYPTNHLNFILNSTCIQ